MRQRQVLVAVATVAAVWSAGPLAVAWAAGGEGAIPAGRGAAASAAAPVGKAIAVPGLAALNKRGNAKVASVSCASAGNCAAAGHYTNRAGQQGFVASERRGHWGRAIAVRGLAALNTAGGADVVSASCASPGFCAAGGFYSYGGVSFFRTKAFVVSEHAGRWGSAVALPTGDGAVSSVSCPSARNCVAGGNTGADYTSNHNAFVVQERAGHWGSLRPVMRGLKHLYSWVSSVACPSAGNCAVAGGYVSQSGQQGFVVTERNGVWGTAIEVPGLAALNAGGNANVVSVSCGAAGSCTAGGNYVDGAGHFQAFVATERGGAWANAIEVPGLAGLNKGSRAAVNAVSCGSAASCAAVGAFTDAAGKRQGFVATERNGVWGNAIKVPGLASLNTGGNSQVQTVSCASAGGCAVGGFYSDRSHHHRGFVASEHKGVWGKAVGVPGLGALNTGAFAAVSSISCATPGHCAAGGFYRDRSHHRQGFVTRDG